MNNFSVVNIFNRAFFLHLYREEFIDFLFYMENNVENPG